jgi:hypothetical protein
MRNSNKIIAYVFSLISFSFIANSNGEQQSNAFITSTNKYKKYHAYSDEGSANIIISNESTQAVTNIKFKTHFKRGKYFRLTWIETPGNDNGMKLPNGSKIIIKSEIVSRNKRHEFISSYATTTSPSLERLILSSIGASHGISQYIPVLLIGSKKTILSLPMPACEHFPRSFTYVCTQHHKYESVSYWIDEKTMLIKKITSRINMKGTRIKTTIIYNNIIKK